MKPDELSTQSLNFLLAGGLLAVSFLLAGAAALPALLL